MKRFLVLFSTSLLVLGFTSCKKCTTCEIRNINTLTTEASYEEYCGSKDDVEAFKKSLELKKDRFLGSNGQVFCTDN